MTSEVSRSSVLLLCYCSSVSHYTRNAILKDVRAKLFQSIDFLKYLLQSDHELLVSEMQKRKMGLIDFVSEIQRIAWSSGIYR